MSSFENLNVWQISLDLVTNLYNDFKDSKEWGIKDQIIRAALSISSNIAEGHERNSDKEFIRFLNIAIASNAELRSQLYFVKKAGLLKEDKANEYIELTRKISAMIVNLVKSIRNK